MLISVLISKAFKLEYPFFAAIAAIFSMENSIASTYKAGLYRLIGTLIGAIVGVIFVYIQPGNAFLMGIGTVVLIFICNFFKWDRAVPVAGVMFAAIMLSLNNKNPLQYSLSRVLDTFVGIAVAVTVNKLIFPPNNLAQIRERLNDISKKIATIVADFVSSGKTTDLTGLRTDVIDLIKFLEAYKVEFNPKTDRDTEFSTISEELETLRSILSHLRTIEELGPGCSLNSDNAEQNIVYNYHVKKILDALPKLSSYRSK